VFILSSTGEPRGSRAGPVITLISSLCWCAASPQAVWCMRLPRGALAVHTRQTADEATGSWYALRDISKTFPLVYTATASGFWTAPGRVIGHISSYPQNGRFPLFSSTSTLRQSLEFHRTPEGAGGSEGERRDRPDRGAWDQAQAVGACHQRNDHLQRLQ